MKTINIKGKPYVMVNERIKEFRENEKYKGWSLISEIVNINDNSCVIKAIISDENGVIKATGFAQEDKTSSVINKTSFVEYCETSAWGRALGNLGIGIDESIASAEEVAMAIAKQVSEPQNVVGGDYQLTFGKYAGETLNYIYEQAADYKYLKWLEEKGDDEVKKNIAKFKEDLRKNE